MRYRKKPVVIEAVQVMNYNAQKLEECFNEFPDWLDEAFKKNMLIRFFPDEKSIKSALRFGVIKTMEGELNVGVGNWIIQGVKGELYPCDDEIFRMTYEEVNKNAQ